MNFFHTTITPQAIERVNQVLASGYLSEGEVVADFERALEFRFGFHGIVAVNSGTSALHLALLEAEVKPGDEVITTPQTFIATSLAVLYCGAKPVFADINPLTGNIDPKSVAAKITERTKAILGVHWGGYPYDMDEICNLVEDDISIIDDAAHALGASYKDSIIGANYSDFTCFSFQAIKSLATGGDGGAVVASYAHQNTHMRQMRWFNISRTKSLPGELGERWYELNEIGFKYHMNNVSAAIGLGNLVGFEERFNRRSKIASRYQTMLGDIPGLILPKYKPDRESAYWLFPVLVERRLDFVRKLKSCGVPTSVVHQRIDRHPLFGGKRDDLPGMDYFDAHQIHLPIHDALTDDDVDLVVKTIREGW